MNDAKYWDKPLLKWDTAIRSHEVLFYTDKFIAKGGNVWEYFNLTWIPIDYSDSVYKNGVNQIRHRTWYRNNGDRLLQVDYDMECEPGDVITVKYAYNPQVPQPAFREIDLPNEFRDDDDSYVEFLLPAGFTFHGFTTALVCSNGLVVFNRGGGGIGGVSYKPVQIYEEGYCLAPYWMDHDTRHVKAGAVRYGVVDVNGKTAFVVIWDKVAIYSASWTAPRDERRSRFQLVLYKEGDVEFNYDTIQTDCGDASSVNYTIWCDPEKLETMMESFSSSPYYMDTNAAYRNSWAGPIVGYFLPGHLWVHPYSASRDHETDNFGNTMYPEDPVYQEGYPQQGRFGLTDENGDALSKGTNCSVPGRLFFPGLGVKNSEIPPIDLPSYVYLASDSEIHTSDQYGQWTTVVFSDRYHQINWGVAQLRCIINEDISDGRSMRIYYAGSPDDVVIDNYYYYSVRPFVDSYPDFPPVHSGAVAPEAGDQMLSAPFWVDPFGQPGDLKIAINADVSQVELVYLQRVHYVDPFGSP